MGTASTLQRACRNTGSQGALSFRRSPTILSAIRTARKRATSVTSSDPLPAIVHIHGGGFVMGAPEMKDVENRLFASELKCAIYSVDHRLAPEITAPGAGRGHLFGLRLAARECRPARARSGPHRYQG